jgi:hypothetical protein
MRLPALPKLDSDLALQVFTHASLKRDDLDNHWAFGDNERLGLLGDSVLRYVLTIIHFRIGGPILGANDIKVTLDNTMFWAVIDPHLRRVLLMNSFKSRASKHSSMIMSY